jgi:hypothetical protein
VYLHTGDTARALSYCDRVIAIESKSVISLFSRIMRAHILGHIDEGRALLRERDKIPAVDGEQWFNVAEEEALLKDAARTARSLRNAIEGGFFNYPLMLTDSFLDPVRDDPAIRTLIGEAKAKREAFIKRFNLSPTPG